MLLDLTFVIYFVFCSIINVPLRQSFRRASGLMCFDFILSLCNDKWIQVPFLKLPYPIEPNIKSKSYIRNRNMGTRFARKAMFLEFRNFFKKKIKNYE